VRVEAADILAYRVTTTASIASSRRRSRCSSTGITRPRSWPGSASRGPGVGHRVLLAPSTHRRAREIFLGQVCPGLQFDTVEEWVRIYSGAGLTDVRTTGGPFAMMTARGFLADEGSHAVAGTARATTRSAYLRKMAWRMPRMARAVRYLGYVVVDAANHPSAPTRRQPDDPARSPSPWSVMAMARPVPGRPR
jgi:hypothetical protein